MPKWVNHCVLMLAHHRLLILQSHCPMLDYRLRGLLIKVHPHPMLECHLGQPLMPVRRPMEVHPRGKHNIF